MRERLGALRELEEDDPAAERPAGDAEQRDLHQRTPADRVGPRVGERVQDRKHQW